MAKVILSESPSYALTNPSMHVALSTLYLAGSLRQAGHEVKVVDCHRVTSWDRENKKLIIHQELLEECDILGISCLTPNYVWGSQLAAAWPAKIKVAGGYHVSEILHSRHERFKRRKYFQGFDFLMHGECEVSFAQFCDSALERVDYSTPGLAWFNEDDSITANPLPALPDVNIIAPPAYDLWEGSFSTGGLNVHSTSRSVDDNRKVGSMFTSRGCPFGCFFCADARTKLRDENVSRIEGEVAQLAGFDVGSVRIWDDVLTIKDQRCRQVSDVLADHGMLWRGWTRVNLRDPDLFRYMAQKGCTELGFGVEHGSARMLKAMNKGTTPEANEIGIKMAQDAGIVARAYIIVGFPGETQESLQELWEWLDKVRPDAASLHFFQPFPGSAVWNDPERFGVTIPEDAFPRMWEFEIGGDENPENFVLDLPTISKEELLYSRKELKKWITENIGGRDR